MVELYRNTPAQDALVAAGFRPSRYSGPVRIIRRFLWPFIRPFHFHTLNRTDALANELAAALLRVEALAGEFGAMRDRAAQADVATQALRAEVANQAAQSDDLARALGAVAADKDALDAALGSHSERLEALGGRTEALRETLNEALNTQVRVLGERLEAVGGRTDALAEALALQIRALEESTPRTEDIQHLLALFATQRGELVALSNRHAWVEAALEDGKLHARLGAVEQRLAEQGAEEQARDARLAELLGREQRRKLFLANLREGTFILKEGELISDMAAREGVWDAHILAAADCAVAAARARPGARGPGCAVDVGGHFGLISVALARRFDSVISFEPNSFNVSLLRANVALNGLSDRVEVRQAGLFSHETRLSLAPSERQEIPLPLTEQGELDPLSATNLGAYSFAEDGSGLSEVPAYPLDSLALNNLSFVKVDVQGADGEVLLGAAETMARCRPWVVFEWEEALSRGYGVRFEDLELQLKEQNYVLRVLKRHNEKQVDYLALPAEAEADAAELFVAGQPVRAAFA